MATVRISLETGSGDFKVELSTSETLGEAFGSSRKHLDNLVDEAVRRIKRAYTPPAPDEA